jgi:hypothetical protein
MGDRSRTAVRGVAAPGAALRRVAGRTVAAGAAALCVAVCASPAVAAAPGPQLPQYRTADGAQRVEGTASSADGPQLKAGGTYTDTLGPGEKRYYTVTLDATSDVYVSAVAAPKPGTKVAYDDGIELSLASPDNTSCGTDPDPSFSSDNAARPIAGYASRRIRQDGECQQAGTYNFSVARGTDPGSAPVRWPIEIRFMVEPHVKAGPTAAPPSGSWSTVAPEPPTGVPQVRRGGTGFNDARSLSTGVWKDRILPGETRFYRVPVDWGQQLFGTAEFANAQVTDDDGFASDGLRVELYNTARGWFDGGSSSYDGEQSAIPFHTAPANYANRLSDDGTAVDRMRFSGWYYLAVGVHQDVAKFVHGSVPVTLRLRIKGAARPGPHYEGDAARAGFAVTGDDRDAARQGLTGGEAAGRSATLRLVGYAGIGAGTVLVLGLAVWTVAARRRGAERAPVVPGAGGGPGFGGGQGFGPPPAW